MGNVSGPILDRIDLCVELSAVSFTELKNNESRMTTKEIREIVQRVRKRQSKRFEGTGYRFNGDIASKDMDRFCHLSPEAYDCIGDIYKSMKLSARAYHRMLKVARTIADIEESEDIKQEHLLEAFGYRPDGEYWNF